MQVYIVFSLKKVTFTLYNKGIWKNIDNRN